MTAAANNQSQPFVVRATLFVGNCKSLAKFAAMSHIQEQTFEAVECIKSLHSRNQSIPEQIMLHLQYRGVPCSV